MTVSVYSRKRKRLGRVFRISGCPGRGIVPGLDALPEDRLVGRTGAITPADEATASGSTVKDASAFTPLRCGYEGLVQPLPVAGYRSSTGWSYAGVGMMARPGRAGQATSGRVGSPRQRGSGIAHDPGRGERIQRQSRIAEVGHRIAMMRVTWDGFGGLHTRYLNHTLVS